MKRTPLVATPRPSSTFTAKAEPSHAKATATLSLTASAEQEPPDVFVYDPEVPVLAPGGPLALSGMFDQTALESGNNLLVYTSEPLSKPCTSLARHASWPMHPPLHRAPISLQS